MSSSEERMKILKMVQDGKIKPAEGIQLLEALESASKRNAADADGLRQPRWFHVRVTDTDTGKPRVNIRLPISVIGAGIKMGAKFSTEVEGLDHDQLMQFIRAGVTGQIIDVYDEKDGEHVEVFLE